MQLATPTPTDPRARLGLYLAGHQSGAAAAMATAERAREAEGDSDLGRALATFLAELEDDRAVLRAAQRDLGVEPGGVTGVLQGATDGVRRLLRVVATARRSPLTRVAELELLVTGVTGKIRAWEVLGERAGDEPALADTDWEALEVQARGQREVLLAHHRQAAREAFATGCSRDAAAPTPG